MMLPALPMRDMARVLRIDGEIRSAMRVPTEHLCRYRPDLMAGGDDCVNCGRPYADHKAKKE